MLLVQTAHRAVPHLKPGWRLTADTVTGLEVLYSCTSYLLFFARLIGVLRSLMRGTNGSEVRVYDAVTAEHMFIQPDLEAQRAAISKWVLESICRATGETVKSIHSYSLLHNLQQCI
jgi:hypothetical protein